MKKMIKLAENYASKYWNKDEDDIRTESYGDLWCHYHNSHLQGQQDAINSINWEEIAKNMQKSLDNLNPQKGVYFDVKDNMPNIIEWFKEQINKQLE